MFLPFVKTLNTFFFSCFFSLLAMLLRCDLMQNISRYVPFRLVKATQMIIKTVQEEEDTDINQVQCLCKTSNKSYLSN